MVRRSIRISQNRTAVLRIKVFGKGVWGKTFFKKDFPRKKNFFYAIRSIALKGQICSQSSQPAHWTGSIAGDPF